MSKPNKILVTGGAGFIGSAVVRRIVNQTENQVICVDNLSYAANLKSLSDVTQSNRFIFEKTDIRDEVGLGKLISKHKPDKIMHLAAESHVDRSIDSPLTFADTNVMGTCNLLQVALKYFESLDTNMRDKFRFHHISTDEVFGTLSINGSPFDPETPYDPRSPYAASKAASDHMVRAWGNTYGLPVILSNCSNNYGPYQFPEKLIPLITIRALAGKNLPIYGNGKNIRDWIHVEDHAEALSLILENGELGQTYLVGGNTERSNIDVVHNICEILDDRRPGKKHSELIEYVQDRPGHDLRYAINGAQMEEELDWRPKIEFNAGLAQTVDWYILNENWWRPTIENIYDGRRLGNTKSNKENGTK